MTTTIQTIALADISPDPGNNREDLGDITGLAASIKSTGLQQLVKLRPAGEDEIVDTPWVITYGHRRFAALQELGITEHDFVVGGNGVQSKLAQVVENVQREDLNPFEEGDAYADLASQYGMTQKQIAEAVGKDAGTVSKRLTMAKLSTEARAALGRAEQTSGEEILDIARLCVKVPDEVWATVKTPKHLRDLVDAQRRNAKVAQVKRAVTKLYKAAKNGRPVEIVRHQGEFEIPEKKGKIGKAVRQTAEGVPWGVSVDDIADLPVDKNTQFVTYDGWNVGCYSIEYISESDIEARNAELADDNARRDAERAARTKAQTDALAQVFTIAANQPKAEQVAQIIAFSLDELTSGGWGRSATSLELLAEQAGVELVTVPVWHITDEDGEPLDEPEQALDDEGEPIVDVDVAGTKAAILAAKQGIPTIAGSIAVKRVQTTKYVERTKGETTKVFKSLDPDEFAYCPLYEAWVAGRIEFTTHSL